MNCISSEAPSPSFVPISEEEWAAVDIQVARTSMAQGIVASVASLLASSKVVERIQAHGGEEGAALLPEARDWLKNAMAYEAIHGRDSLLDLSSPWVRDVLIPAKERLRLRRRRRLKVKTTVGVGVF